MLNKEIIQDIIFKSLKNINEERDSDKQLMIDVNTSLFGVDSDLDSLSLVSLIVDVESAVSERLGHEISLTDDRAMSQEVSPFSHVNSLTSYIELLISEVV